jgi:hypothetical protein
MHYYTTDVKMIKSLEQKEQWHSLKTHFVTNQRVSL